MSLIDNVFWFFLIGLIIGHLLDVPKWIVRTEAYIKAGVVLLGCRIALVDVCAGGLNGIVQAVVVVSITWSACYWIARKLKVDDDLAAILSSAVSICGVSAAIVTAYAVRGDAKKLAYATSLTILCAIPMFILMPMIARELSLSDVVAGAWIGGTLDTTATVVAAGKVVGDVAMKTGVLVKMSQNILIGVVAFVLAAAWAIKKPGSDRPAASEIWQRFPKFVIAFLAMSLLFSVLPSTATVAEIKHLFKTAETGLFALGFVCIGIEARPMDMLMLNGGRPAAAFVIAQSINIVLALVVAALLFG